MGPTLSACDGTPGGLSSTSGQEVHASLGHDGPPLYSAYGPHAGPGYVAPYAYQPGYGGSCGYEPGWGGRRDGWREHEGRGRGERASKMTAALQSATSGPRQRPNGRPAAEPAPIAPLRMASPPPPAARPQVDQNRKLLDQLGFRPSR